MTEEYKTYIPEYDYAATNYRPLGKSFTKDQCGDCKKYYKMLFEKGLTKSEFPVPCQGHVMDQVALLRPSDFETEDEYEEAKILIDPVAWAKYEFDWDHRWYQELVSSCTAKTKILRGGRRSGKSRVEIILMLHEMMTLPNRRVLLLCPSERLIGEFFEVVEEFIKKSTSLRSSIERNTKNPHLLRLKNGSKLLGISISPKDPDAGDKARGFDAHLVIIDEAEMFKDKDMDAILALLASSEETRVMISSTPKGLRKHFYHTCTNKDMGYKEFWWISAEKPDWTPDMERTFKAKFNPTAYTQEFDADFGDLQEGVFKKKFLDAAISDYDTINAVPTGGKYVLGVDWNRSAGVHMAIIEIIGNTQMKLIQKLITPESEYMQTQAVQDIIKLHSKWRFMHIFVDRGYGDTQIELLRQWGTTNPASGLAEAVKGIHMNQHIEVRDPVTGLPEKRFAKPFIVQQTAKLLEDGNLILPKSEDYGHLASEDNEIEDIGLVQQMRNYKVESYSIYNQPRYSQGADHTLTAFMLACAGWVLYEGDLNKINYFTKVLSIPANTTPAVELPLTAIEREKDLTKFKLINATGRVAEVRKPAGIRDLDKSMNSRNPYYSPHPGNSSRRSSFGKPKGRGTL